MKQYVMVFIGFPRTKDHQLWILFLCNGLGTENVK
jgi:hypothetical protein